MQPPKAIAMGDSLIYGYGDPDGGGWVERLRRQWMRPEQAGPILYNLGVRGDGVSQVLQRWEAEFFCRGELRNRQPDILLLSVGVNDSARLGKPDGKNFTDFDGYCSALTELLARARQQCPVWMVGMIPVEEARMPFFECFYYSHAEQYRYKEAAKQMCCERQIPYLDLFDLWLARGSNWRSARMCPDGLHPNTVGYESILQDVSAWWGSFPNM
ncbi:MAG: GDSL-type esterase/lipase family protein [Cyanobacteria bacterium P01_D01_bin.123]